MRIKTLPRTMLRAFFRDYGSRLGFFGVAAVVLAAIVAPMFPQHHVAALQAPSWEHLLGTSVDGRDVFVAILHGARSALVVGLTAAGINAMAGLFLGAIAGFYGGRVDRLLTRFIEVLLSVPSILGVLALRGVAGDTRLWDLALVLGFLRWTDIARVVRAEVLRVRSSDWITAAFALGNSPFGVLWRHILPDAVSPVLVMVPFAALAAISIEVSLAVVDVGATATTMSWGGLLSGSIRHREAWWLGVFPGLAFLLTTVSLNLVGEALRSASDPLERTTARKNDAV